MSKTLHQQVADPSAVARALADGADPDARDAAGDTPLHACAWSRGVESARLLLAHGADASARNRRGVPALHEAARRGARELALLLLDHGSAIDDHAEDDGSTPLHWAVKGGWDDVVRHLLDAGAGINARDGRGRTPLQWLLLRDHLRSAEHQAILHLLLSRGAAHTAETAVTRGTAAHVRAWLTRGTRPDARAGDGGSLLALAAEQGGADVVAALLDAGAHPDGARFDARSPLLRAVAARRPDAVRLLLEAGADPERGEDGVLPLDAAVDRSAAAGRPDEIGALLLAHGARPTPQWAVIHDDPALLRDALAAGWHVDRRGRDGATPLLLAARIDRAEAARALLDAGADPSAADDGGRTPLHAAAEPCEGRPRIAELLVARGADPNAADARGRTPLHAALGMLHSFCVNREIVRILLDAGADPGLRDAEGRTPLEVDAHAPLHHDVNGDPETTYARMRAAVAEVTEMLREASARRRRPPDSRP